MSNITQTSNQINPAFPVAGQNNSSQGFRSNWAAIQQSLTQASVELTKLQRTRLVLLGDVQASSQQLDQASALGPADPNLNITVSLQTTLPGGATLNSNTGDFQIVVDDKGRIIGKTTIQRTISWGSWNAGQPILPPTSLGTGSGSVQWPALVFDQLGRLTQVTNQALTYGLLGHTLARGSLISAGSANTSLAIAPPGIATALLAYTNNGATGLEWLDQIAIKTHECMILTCGDETTPLVTGTQITIRLPYAFTVQDIRASLSTPQTSGTTLILDVKASGTSILSSLLTIDNAEKTSKTATSPVVISNSNLADDTELTVTLNSIGDGTATGLKLYLIGHRT